MATLKYINPDTGEYQYIALNGSTPYIDSNTNNWAIEGEDTGVRAIQDIYVYETDKDFTLSVNGEKTLVNKAVDQILGLDIVKISEDDNAILTDSYNNYDYLVIRYKDNNGYKYHTTIMCDEITEEDKYGLCGGEGYIMFPSALTYYSNINIYEIDGVRTADETTALEIANKILEGKV